jgi:two-component system sensor kinase FixL
MTDVDSTEPAERAAHLQSVLDTVPDAVILIDTSGIIQSYSKTAERMFGYAAEESIGENVSMLMAAPDRQRHDLYLAQYHSTGEPRVIGRSRTTVGLRKDGSTFPLELSVSEIRTGERRLYSGFVRDMTERQTAQKQIQDLQQELLHISRLSAMGEMASTLAHELNQPLAAATGYLNGMQRLLDAPASPDLDLLRDATRRAAEQTRRAGEIIRRLRGFVTQGKGERAVEDLAEVVREAAALGLIGAKEAGVHASFALHEAPVRASVDRIQIQQVLVNLIRNAIEAMDAVKHRRLVLSLPEAAGGTVEVGVADTGPGISPEVATRLFQPFNSSKTHGMGLGLSISRTIIEAHGGRLWAEANPGGGTIFRFSLPTAEHAGGNAMAGKTTAKEAGRGA